MAPGIITDLHGIPYLNHEQLAGRFITSLAFHDTDWRVWLDINQDMQQFVEVKAWPAESFYWSREPQSASDINSYFMNFIAQRANFPQIMNKLSAMQDDYLNIAASFSKLNLIFEHEKAREGSSRLATTELEYLLITCRSIFDLLQEIIEKIWSQVSLLDPSGKKRQLKNSFSKMTLCGQYGDILLTEAEIEKNFFLPTSIAQCYIRHGGIFNKIRKFRDDIIHRGYTSEIIFRGEHCFLIRKQIGPFRNLDIWRPEEVETNELAPLMPVLGMITHATLLACEDFARTLLDIIAFPPPIVPDMHLFMRGYHNNIFLEALLDADMRLKEGRSLLTQYRK